MKYIKTFEKKKEHPAVGDYVVLKIEHKSNVLVIGKIFFEDFMYFYIKYKLPDGHTFNDIFLKNNIIDWSKTKKNLEHYITTNKYNL